jgi:hypothetical protein
VYGSGQGGSNMNAARNLNLRLEDIYEMIDQERFKFVPNSGWEITDGRCFNSTEWVYKHALMMVPRLLATKEKDLHSLNPDQARAAIIETLHDAAGHDHYLKYEHDWT